MRELWELFITFAKIGCFTFGGGYAMLPMLQREIVENKGWATEEDLMDYYAVGQCTPGIIAVNTATFVGRKIKGIPGALAGTLGMVFPSIVIIMLIAAFVSNFTHLAVVKHALAGVRVCVCVLVGDAVVKLARKSLVDAGTYIICGAVVILAMFSDIPTALLVLAAGVCGIVFKLIMEKSSKNKEAKS